MGVTIIIIVLTNTLRKCTVTRDREGHLKKPLSGSKSQVSAEHQLPRIPWKILKWALLSCLLVVLSQRPRARSLWRLCRAWCISECNFTSALEKEFSTCGSSPIALEAITDWAPEMVSGSPIVRASRADGKWLVPHPSAQSWYVKVGQEWTRERWSQWED